MSAWMLPHHHVVSILHTIRRDSNSPDEKYVYPVYIYFGQEKLDLNNLEDLERIAVILINQNIRSYDDRYHVDDTVLLEKLPENIMVVPLTLFEAYKACNCYDYQSCETSDWERTDAHHILLQLKDYLADEIISNLPDFDKADNGWPVVTLKGE